MIPYMAHITVHDSATVRDSPDHGYDFTKNGLAILQPMDCKVIEERNGAYYCELTHPIDEAGAWMHLNENNIISVPIIYHGEEKRQLFRIAVREVKQLAKKKNIYVRAYHIWYDLRARVVINPDTNQGGGLVGMDCQTAMEWLMSQVYTLDGFIGGVWYPYTVHSDITDYADYTWNKPMTIPDLMILSDHSLTELYKGEIYRDNFYFSICSKKEGSRKIADPIRYGVNMLDITERADWSDYCNYAHAYDNFDYWKDVSFTAFGSAPGDIVKAKQFNYKYFSEKQLTDDMFTLFEEYSQPSITYSIEFSDIRANPEYAAFRGLETYEVCDSVDIISERLGIRTTQQIVQKVYDVLRRRTVSIKLGNLPKSITRKSTLEDTAYDSGADVQALKASMPGEKTNPKSDNSGAVYGDKTTNSASGAYAQASGTEASATGAYSNAESKSTAAGVCSHADSAGNVGNYTMYCNASSGGTIAAIVDITTGTGITQSVYSAVNSYGKVNGGNGCFAAAAGVVENGKNSVALCGAETEYDNAFAAGLGCKASQETACLGKYGESGGLDTIVGAGKIIFAVGWGESEENRYNMLELTDTGKLYINGKLAFDSNAN